MECNKCICTTFIKKRYYIYSKEKDDILIIGKCCCVKFISLDKHCEICNEILNSRLDNLCKVCKKKMSYKFIQKLFGSLSRL